MAEGRRSARRQREGGAPPPLLPLTAEGLALRIGGKTILGPLDLCVTGKGITVVMGPNGAGKSVLLRLLHGLIRPSAGRIAFAGRPLGEAVRRRQAMVFQKPVLLRRSVAANIDFALKLRSVPDAARRRDTLLELAGLKKLARRAAAVLSGGQQQRLAIARALALDPEILFLDEPTASLDPAATLSIEQLAENVRDRGVKIMLITHDSGQARRLGDDIVFLHHGRICEHSPAERFFDAPASVEAAAYLAGKIIV